MRKTITGGYMAAAALIAAGLSGCARMTSIHRVTDVPSDRTTLIAVDAKQRAIIGGAYTTTETVKKNDVETETVTDGLRFCAEPPPDALTALATSLAAEASVGGDAGNDAALKLASSLSENATTIERSQTVNILREAMYRNCERYLSGAIDRDEFIVQAARDQQMIIQVLAIEQLTGAARAQATALTTVARAVGSGTTEATILALDAARKDKLAKKAAATQALSIASSKEPIDKSCSGAPHAVPAGAAEADATKLNAKNEACAAAEVAANAAREAEEHYSALSTAVARQSAVSVEASGNLDAEKLAANTVSADIANAIVQITQQSHVLDEVVLACMVHVRKVLATDPKAALNPFCQTTLTTMQQARAQQLLGLAQPSDARLSATLNALAEPPSLAPLLLAYLESFDPGQRSVALSNLFSRVGVKTLAPYSSAALVAAVPSKGLDAISTALYPLTTDERKRLAAALAQ